MSQDRGKRRNDMILFLGIIILGIFMWLVLHFFVQKDGKYVVITIDGNLYGTYSLQEDRTVEVLLDGIENVVQIKDGQVSMEKADCPDQICVKHYPIFKAGDTIVCLPHRVVVEVTSKDSSVKGNLSNEEGVDGVAK